MKFSVAISTFFAAAALAGMSNNAEASTMDGTRHLRSHHDSSSSRYTVYIANTCNDEIGVTIDDHSEVFSRNSCHVFNGGQQYHDLITYRPSGPTGIASGNVSCQNIGSSNNDECNLDGMETNACVIPIDLCQEVEPPKEPECTRHCSKGKPCGDSCIADGDKCHKLERGKACWAEQKCTKFCDKGQACGNSCISKDSKCHLSPGEGFACNKEDY